MDEKPVILIVDPVEANRTVLKGFFQEDYEIVETPDGKGAITLMSSRSVNVILAALDMPGMDALELMAVTKHTPGLAETPVVVITDRGNYEGEANAVEMGAADFITKPFHPAVVRRRIKNVLGGHENEWRKALQEVQDQELLEMQPKNSSQRTFEFAFALSPFLDQFSQKCNL